MTFNSYRCKMLMQAAHRTEVNMKKKRLKVIIASAAGIILIAVAAAGIRIASVETPDELLDRYTSYIETSDYEKMYEMLDEESQSNITQEDFIARNQNIYEGAEASDIAIEIKDISEHPGFTALTYDTTMQTIAGEVQFESRAVYNGNRLTGFHLVWEDALIFPQLTAENKIRVVTDPAERGEILDRNGKVLAGNGLASAVGLVPGKMDENPGKDIEKIAALLEISEESIRNRLEASWVQEESFVPIKTMRRIEEIQKISGNMTDREIQDLEIQEKLLEIPGVMVSDTKSRVYPFGEKAAHLTGYVQNVTAEDLEEHEGEGYRSDSVIGRSGMEGLYEKELKGEDGHQIVVVDEQGKVQDAVAMKVKKNGEDIKLTIDSELQTYLYNTYKQDKSTSVAMDPITGEVLALVSTPSYDSTDFTFGMSDALWTSLNEDESMPMNNRFRQYWCPGSSFKPITAAIGVDTGAIEPDTDLGSEGLSWQKDETWGGYYVTTLHDYSPVTLENALIYSDNIYFAKAALAIGAEGMQTALDKLGFGEKLPFEITMTESQYANESGFESEIQLADSGYGQGQILMNPLHLASLYTAFVNEGSVVKPYLRYAEGVKKEIWFPQAFSSETAERVKNALIQVVENPNGTGYGVRREGLTLAGKTGTAEIKASVEDKDGTELGWLGVFTADAASEKQFLIMTMVEDVKDRGGSGYVVERTAEVLNSYLR